MNTVSITGHLDNDPVRRDTTRGVVAGVRLAVDERPNRIWIGIEAWGTSPESSPRTSPDAATPPSPAGSPTASTTTVPVWR